jgi:hypothetical protein
MYYAQRVWIPLHICPQYILFMSLFTMKFIQKKAISFRYIGSVTPDTVWRLVFLIYGVTASLSSSDWALSHPRSVRCIAVMCGSYCGCITWATVRKTKQFFS